MQMGVDLNSDEERNKVFGNVTFRVRYLDETSEQSPRHLHHQPGAGQRSERLGPDPW